MRIFALLVGSKYLCMDGRRDNDDGYTRLGQLDDDDVCLYSTFEDAVNNGRSVFHDFYCNKFKVVEIITVPDSLLAVAIPDVSTNNYLIPMTNVDNSQPPTQRQSDKVSYYKNGKFDLVELSDGRLIQPIRARSFFESVDERNFTM